MSIVFNTMCLPGGFQESGGDLSKGFKADLLEFLPEMHHIGGGPLGREALLPELGACLLGFELGSSVFAVCIGGPGCHSKRLMIGCRVWSQRGVFMNLSRDFKACKEVINDAGFLGWSLSRPWEPCGSQVDK